MVLAPPGTWCRVTRRVCHHTACTPSTCTPGLQFQPGGWPCFCFFFSKQSCLVLHGKSGFPSCPLGPLPRPGLFPVSHSAPYRDSTVPARRGVDLGPEKAEGNGSCFLLEEGVSRLPSHPFPMSTAGLWRKGNWVQPQGWV